MLELCRLFLGRNNTSFEYHSAEECVPRREDFRTIYYLVSPVGLAGVLKHASRMRMTILSDFLKIADLAIWNFGLRGVGGGGTMIRPKDTSLYERINVPIIPINSILEEIGQEEIGFMKMDVEGLGLELLKALSDKVASKIKTIFLEYHPPIVEFRQVRDILENKGFKVINSKDLHVLIATKLST